MGPRRCAAPYLLPTTDYRLLLTAYSLLTAYCLLLLTTAQAPRYRTIASVMLLVCVPLIMGFGAVAATCLGRRTPDNVLLGLHSEVRTPAK